MACAPFGAVDYLVRVNDTERLSRPSVLPHATSDEMAPAIHANVSTDRNMPRSFTLVIIYTII